MLVLQLLLHMRNCPTDWIERFAEPLVSHWMTLSVEKQGMIIITINRRVKWAFRIVCAEQTNFSTYIHIDARKWECFVGWIRSRWVSIEFAQASIKFHRIQRCTAQIAETFQCNRLSASHNLWFNGHRDISQRRTCHICWNNNKQENKCQQLLYFSQIVFCSSFPLCFYLITKTYSHQIWCGKQKYCIIFRV